MPDLSIIAEPAGSPTASALLERYYGELAARFPPGAGGFELERIDAATSQFAAPAGTFLLARLDGRPVGCGALRTLDERTAEIKRMWVDPDARGHGIGRGLLAALERAAVEIGCDTVRLDTSAHLPEALALYASSGYEEIPAYNDNPYAAHWFEKHLP